MANTSNLSASAPASATASTPKSRAISSTKALKWSSASFALARRPPRALHKPATPSLRNSAAVAAAVAVDNNTIIPDATDRPQKHPQDLPPWRAGCPRSQRRDHVHRQRRARRAHGRLGLGQEHAHEH